MKEHAHTFPHSYKDNSDPHIYSNFYIHYIQRYIQGNYLHLYRLIDS